MRPWWIYMFLQERTSECERVSARVFVCSDYLSIWMMSYILSFLFNTSACLDFFLQNHEGGFYPKFNKEGFYPNFNDLRWIWLSMKYIPYIFFFSVFATGTLEHWPSGRFQLPKRLVSSPRDPIYDSQTMSVSQASQGPTQKKRDKIQDMSQGHVHTNHTWRRFTSNKGISNLSVYVIIRFIYPSRIIGKEKGFV